MPMYNDNNKKLRTILLVLAIVLVLLRIVKVAKAEEVPSDYPVGGIPQYVRDYMVNTYFSGASDSYKQSVYDAFNVSSQFLFSEYSDHDCALAVIVKYGTFIWSNGCGNPTINSSDGSYNYTYNSNTFHGISRLTNNQQYGYNSRYSTYNSGDIMIYYFYKINNTFYSQNLICNGLYRDKGSYGYIYYGRGSDNINTSKQEASGFGTVISYGDVFCFSALNSTFWIEHPCLIRSNYQNIIPSYTEDSRLKFWTFDNLDGSKTLVTSFDDFCVDSIFVQNQFNNIVLTYELDNIEHTVSLNASNSVVRSTQNQNGGNITYKLETPFSVFGFDDSIVSFKITKCDFTYVKTTMNNIDSTAYKISCNYSAYSRSVPVEPAVIPSPAAIYVDPASSVDISDREYDFFQQLQTSVMGGDIVYINNYPTLPAWANVYNLNTFFYDSNPDDLHIYLGTQITGAYRASQYDFDIKAFLYDNATSKFYDVIIIRIDETDWPMVVNSDTIPNSQELYGYVVLYTDSYYKRLDAETQIDILEAIQLDANQQLANWSWLVAKIDDFEIKSLDSLNASLDIDTDSLSWLKTIDNSIKSLDFPVFDDSSILSGLASIVTALSGDADDLGVNGRLDKLINFFVANEAERNDSALTYRNWLDGLDPTETRRVTHFGTNIYSLVKNIFDIFDADYTEDPSFENPDKDYLGIASDYIDALNNRNNTNKFFRGFFDSSFDPLEQSGLPEE